jgi:hypothetical protein
MEAAMYFGRSKGAAKVLFLLPALVVAAGLVYYLYHTGKFDPAVFRQWQVQATNLFRQATGQPHEAREKIMTADPGELSASLGEAQIGERFRALELSCYSVRDPLGDYTCTAPVALFNGIRARSASFFFAGDRLTSLRVTFDAGQQQGLAARYQTQYGQPAKLGLVDPHSGRRLQGWKVAHGTLGVSDVVPGDRETVLLWVASSAATRAAVRP